SFLPNASTSPLGVLTCWWRRRRARSTEPISPAVERSWERSRLARPYKWCASIDPSLRQLPIRESSGWLWSTVTDSAIHGSNQLSGLFAAQIARHRIADSLLFAGGNRVATTIPDEYRLASDDTRL